VLEFFLKVFRFLFDNDEKFFDFFSGENAAAAGKIF